MSAKQRVRVRAGGHLGVVVPMAKPLGKMVREVIDSTIEMVDKGKVDSIAVAITYHDGSVDHGFAVNVYGRALAGAIEEVKSFVVDRNRAK